MGGGGVAGIKGFEAAFQQPASFSDKHKPSDGSRRGEELRNVSNLDKLRAYYVVIAREKEEGNEWDDDKLLHGKYENRLSTTEGR